MGRRWVTAAGTIRAIAEIDPDVAARILGSRDAIALGGWPGATTGRSWAGSARFAEDVSNGTIQDGLQVRDAAERLDVHARVVDGHYLSLARLRLPEVATAFLAETVTTDP